ncbi:MAG: hypothetical protein R6U66_03690 [Bacteroidales bacterium]|jgi:drug/metabolite transporter (DMT)-like permease
MSKVLRIVLLVLLLVSVVFTAMFYAGPTIMVGGDEAPVYTETFIIWAYALAGIAVALSLIFPIFQMISNPQKAKKGLLGVVLLGVVVLIAYMLAGDTPLGITNPDLVHHDVPSTLKQVGTGIQSMYLLIGLAIASILFTEVAKVFK